MNRTQLKISTTLATAIILLFGFNNCGRVAFQAVESGVGDFKTDVVAMDGDSVVPAPVGDTAVIAPEVQPPHIDTDVVVPELPMPSRDITGEVPDAPQEPVVGSSGQMCGFPVFPKSIQRRCSEAGPSEQKLAAVEGRAEVYSFAMYNTTNLSHATHVLAPQGLSGDRYSTTMNVAIPAGTNDVILILSAYEPTEWNIIGSVERVKKVILLGYHCATAVGVSSSIVENNAHGDYLENLGAAVSRGATIAAQNNGMLVKAQYTYEGTCVDQTFVAAP